MNILIAEDESIIALDIKRSLLRLGYTVSGVADTGERAIEEAASLQPDLILMDVMLKGGTSGIEAASIIRARQDTPIIYLTAHADARTIQQAKLTGPYGYLIKPVSESELYTTIETAMHRRRLEQDVRESEKRYRTLVETISHGIIEFDAAGTIIFCNNALSRLTGYETDRLEGSSIWSILHAAAPPAGEAGVPESFSDRITARDGRIVDVRVDWNRKPGGNGQGGYIAVITDFTEKLRTQDRLTQSLEKLKRTLGATVNALATTIERRDPYTAGHQQRVALLACAIARELAVPPERIEGINIAALVHDIGKIHIPSEILSKPSRLTEIEFAMIKTHAQVGYDILKDIEFDMPVPSMVLQHHEKLDGSGYPGGLRDDEIIFEARIISVADIVEAMASHRPYRPGLGIDRALEEIINNRGSLYDADVVDACRLVFSGDAFSFNQVPNGRFT